MTRILTLALPLLASCATPQATADLAEVAIPPPPVATTPRDVVLVLDVSLAGPVGGIDSDLYDLVAALGTPTDRIGVVAFAGEAEVVAPLLPVGDPAARDEVAFRPSCGMPADAWLYLYRFEDWATRRGDPELGGPGWTYRFVSPGAGIGGGPGLGIPHDMARFESLWFRIVYPVAWSWTDTDWLRDLSVYEQCAAWDASRLIYEFFDERVATSSVLLGDLGPRCHAGNWYEGRPEALFDDDPTLALTAVDCGTGDVPNTDPPAVAYGGTTTAPLYPDLSYGIAGNHLAAGLEAAETMLANARPGVQPVVIAVTADPDPCPKIGRPAELATCRADRMAAIAAAGTRLTQTLGATLTVLRVENSLGHQPTDVLARIASPGQFVNLRDPRRLARIVSRQLDLLVPPHTAHTGHTSDSAIP